MTKLACAIALLCLLVSASALNAEEFTPSKEITMIVPSSPGGGSDLNARTIANIVQQHMLSPRNIMVVNNGGGSGAVAFTNTYAKKGDNHVLMILHSGQAMGAYVNDWQVKTEDLTFIAVLAFDNLFLAVRSDSPHKDLDSLIKASRANPEEFAIGGSQRGNSDHLAFELFNRGTKAEAAYVSFNGSGDVMSALLGGHIDAGFFNPLEFMGQIQAGEVVPIACFAEKRLGGVFKDIPTFTELGYPDIIMVENRAIAAPPEMDPAAIKFYGALLEKVTQTDEWKNDYLKKNYLGEVFYGPEKAKEYYTKLINEQYKTAFKDIQVN